MYLNRYISHPACTSVYLLIVGMHLKMTLIRVFATYLRYTVYAIYGCISFCLGLFCRLEERGVKFIQKTVKSFGEVSVTYKCMIRMSN